MVHSIVPTTRPRFQVTETDTLARALDKAARRWPGEPRSALLRRLIDVGAAALEETEGDAVRRRREALQASSGKYADVFSNEHLVELRRDWPA